MSKLSSYNTIGKMKRTDAIPFFGHTTPKDIITLSVKTTKDIARTKKTTKDNQHERLINPLKNQESPLKLDNRLMSIDAKKTCILEFIKRENGKKNIEELFKFILERWG